MGWGTKVIATQLTAITSTMQYFTSTIMLGYGEEAHVEVEANFVATPTDDMEVHVFRTLDESAENWDDVSYMALAIDNGIDPSKVSFDLIGGYKYRIGVKSAGATDTHTSADMAYRILTP